MNKTLIASFLAVTTLASATALAGHVISITASGNASDRDKATARKDAEDQAITQANNVCVGKVVATKKTVDTCIDFGEGENKKFSCTVMVRADCGSPSARKK